MKKIYMVCLIPVLLLCFLLFIVCGWIHQESSQTATIVDGQASMVKCSVYINGVLAEGLEAALPLKEETVRLPFLKTVEALGMSIRKIGEGKFLIRNGWSFYVLNGFDLTLVRPLDLFDTENFLLPPPGSTDYFIEYRTNDVILDSITLEGTVYQMGINIDFDIIDYENLSVNIIIGEDLS